MKLIELSEETCHGLERGMNTLTGTVKATLGPKGRNVVLEKKWGIPTITDDGVFIIEKIELDDPYGEIGVGLVKEVARRIGDVAGNGTTTATVMTQAMVREGLYSVTTGANPMALKKDIEAVVTAVAGKLSRLATNVETKEQIAATASVSAADPSVGEVIAEAMNEVGKEGVVVVEESNTFGLELELAEGVRFDKGYTLPHFVTDVEWMGATLDDPYVLIVDSKISFLEDPLPVLKKVVQSGELLLVVAEDVEGEALAGLTANKLRGTFKSIATKVPGSGGRRKAMPGDVAILTGSQVIAEEAGLSLETVTLNLLGKARQIVVTKNECTIIDGNDAQTQIEGRVTQIHREIESSGSDYDREKLQERLAKLAGGVAVIKVGVATEVKSKECKHRVEDAAHSVKTAVKEDIMPGSDVVLLQVSKAVKMEGLDDDEMVGTNVVLATTQAPLRQIAMNAGLEGGVIAEKVIDLSRGHGPDAAIGRYVDMVVAGIIDPAKITCLVLQNVASIATLFLVAEAVIADKPEKAPAATDAPDMDEIGDTSDF